MKISFLLSILLTGVLAGCSSRTPDYFTKDLRNELRAPATPLVSIDPYTSVWSFSDQLNASSTKHWTGTAHPMVGILRVDGTTYRFMGTIEPSWTNILPTAAIERWDAVYTEEQPVGNNWVFTDYNDANWKRGKGAFGTPEMHNLSTLWESRDIWVRRVFELNTDYSQENMMLEYSHDDIFELYINGIQVVGTDYIWRDGVRQDLDQRVRSTLKPGKNIIAAHCHNRTGGGYVDFGLYRKNEMQYDCDKLATQITSDVFPTRSRYSFECGPVTLDLLFTAPLLADDLDLMSRPVNYLTYQVRSSDGKSHDVQIYFDITPEWAVHENSQPICLNSGSSGDIRFLRAGTKEQPVLGKKGDNQRIDWGYFYLSEGYNHSQNMAINESVGSKRIFQSEGTVKEGEDCWESIQMYRKMPVMSISEDLGKVTEKPAGNFVMLAYDDVYSIQYFGENRMPYWKHEGAVDIENILQKASIEYPSVMQRCMDFDRKLLADATRAGGEKYARLCALAYRQAISAHKLVTDNQGELLFLSKENFSNGSIGTVDVTYPSSPLFLLYNPELLKGMLNPIFYYSESGKWPKPFAAHDVGTYPLANGQTYGGDMPVEETGNMLILTAAIAEREKSAEYACKHWDILSIWADYLITEGMDPENQLCTDDFAGHFAHNTNLSIKAILGIASYGKLASMLGKEETGQKYTGIAREMALRWKEMADDGDHYRLTFDRKDTWSQKYNLVWDRLLNLRIFPEEIARKEIAYYMGLQQPYGLPLDSRKTYTKSDWIIWTACMTANDTEFRSLTDPLYKYADETSSRIPLSDWHETTDGSSVGF